MKDQHRLSRKPTRRARRVMLSITLALLLVLAIVVVSARILGNRQASAPGTASSPANPGSPTRTVKASPLLFGTNLGLFTGDDQVITSATTRALMQQLPIRIVRIPTRSHLPNTLELQAMQAVKAIGAQPLVVLTGLRNPNVLADDTRIIQDSNSVFGNSLVYYEFGNEDDWNGLSIGRYTQGWNALIPRFKRLALNSKFIGPVSYQYDHDNLNAFLQNASPRPDAISWHEYSCSYKDPAATCLSEVGRWATHFIDARTVMKQDLGTTLPIMITEWNYAADQSVQNNGQPYDDGKYNNSGFMRDWTSKALSAMAENQVFASMQYSVTNTALPLITYNNTLTYQGMAFQSLYKTLVGPSAPS